MDESADEQVVADLGHRSSSAVYHSGSGQVVRSNYTLQRATFVRPAIGSKKVSVKCATCGTELFVKIHSRHRLLAKRIFGGALCIAAIAFGYAACSTGMEGWSDGKRLLYQLIPFLAFCIGLYNIVGAHGHHRTIDGEVTKGIPALSGVGKGWDSHELFGVEDWGSRHIQGLGLSDPRRTNSEK